MLQKELRCTVEVMLGCSLGFETMGGEDSGKSIDGKINGDGACDLRCQQKLLDLREARLVVATAVALEHAMCKVRTPNDLVTVSLSVPNFHLEFIRWRWQGRGCHSSCLALSKKVSYLTFSVRSDPPLSAAVYRYCTWYLVHIMGRRETNPVLQPRALTPPLLLITPSY